MIHPAELIHHPATPVVGTMYAVVEQYEAPAAYFTTREAADAHLAAIIAAYNAHYVGGDREYIPRFWVIEVPVH